ncbi:MAG: HAD hydrolase family protein [Saprospiraceae bacterium]|nr:HAD hydrolase family protein [Saprospiraceae bacterium]
MYFKIVALDLDGTIAMHDRIASGTWKILKEIKKSGRAILIVTGRRLDDIQQLGPLEDLCEAIIAENGAAIYIPSNQSVILPFGHLPSELVEKLSALNIPLEKGMSIVATREPHGQLVVEAISNMGSAATIEYNKGAIMIIPPGASKGTGLMVALHELGYSHHNVVAFGDAENDRSLFEQAEVALAVENADASIKKLADIELEEPDGEGVANFMRKLLEKEFPPGLKGRQDRKMIIGYREDSEAMMLDPLSFTLKNVGIFGSSGSGKSWLAGLIAEKLLRLEYQICIIDPEGDYRGLKAFPNTLLLGGEGSPPPHSSFVSTLLEYSEMSLVMDLSQYTHQEKLEYVAEIMETLLNLRERRGKPHWFLIDEAHYFLKKGSKLQWTDRIEEGGFALLSYRPRDIDDSYIKKLDNLMITHFEEDDETERLISTVCENSMDLQIREKLPFLTDRQVCYFIKEESRKCKIQQGILEMESTRRKVPHIRHLNKYLRAPLPADKQFYFKELDKTRIPSASSLYDFMRILPRVPSEILAYHLHRGDFEAWTSSTLHDEELSRRIHKIGNRQLEGKELGQALTDAVTSRYEELEILV